jgi:hypothetical protein
MPFWIPDLVTPSIGTISPVGAGILWESFDLQAFRIQYNRHIFARRPIFTRFWPVMPTFSVSIS